jgi:uncharacterized membrane protein
MKPMNFPERRNQRRKEALVRLQEALKVAKQNDMNVKKNELHVRNLEKAIENTEAKIVSGSRFGEQSKIRRVK